MNGLRLYFRYIAISMRAQMQYRVSFAMLTAAMMLTTFIDFFGIYVLFARFGALEGWRFAEVGLFYGMANFSFALCEGWMRGFMIFGRKIRNAEFDQVLLKPRSSVLQILGSEFQLLRIGRLSVAVIVMVWAFASLGIRFGFLKWCLFSLSLLGGVLLFAGIVVIEATVCFWTVETNEMFNAITYGGVEATQHPMSIYDKWLRNFFTFIVPLAAINYWPLSYLLDRGYVHSWLSWLSPLVGAFVFFASLIVWRFGVKHYRSTGS